jgi:small subunit ribosomal protein S17
MNKGETTKKEFKGVVVSNKMEGTVRVEINRPVRHPVYKKVVNKRKNFFAHTDEELNIGDEVTIRESRPYSKKVKWVVVRE